MSNPCLSCGACCAYFRASFHWLETAPSGITPSDMTVRVSPQHVAMRGTEQHPPRCVALHGDIGKAVACSIYPRRASPCRDFQASWVNGVHNERCDRARAAHGLQPLPRDAHGPDMQSPITNGQIVDGLSEAPGSMPAALLDEISSAGEVACPAP